MNEMIVIPELISALTSNFGEDGHKAIAENTAEFAEVVGIRSDVEIKTVQNSDDTLNLVLPFYSDIEKVAGEFLSDEQMGAASGGEDNFSLFQMMLKGSMTERAKAVLIHSEDFDQRLEAYRTLKGIGALNTTGRWY